LNEILPIAENEAETVAPMTLAEARETHRLIRASEAVKRIRVFLMWRRDGYKKMGFPDFKTYCEQGIDIPYPTAQHWLTQVETTLHALGWKITVLDYQLDNFESEKRLIAIPYATELHKLPEPRLRRKAWEQITEIREMATRTSQQQLTELKRIVARIRVEEGLDPAPAPKAAPRPAPSAFDKALLAKKQARHAEEDSSPSAQPDISDIPDTAATLPTETPKAAREAETPAPAPALTPPRLCLEAESVVYSEPDATLILRSHLPDGTPLSLMLPLAMLPEELRPQE